MRNTADIKFCQKIARVFQAGINESGTKREAVEMLNNVFYHQTMVRADVEYLRKNHPEHVRYIESGVCTSIQVTR